MKRRVLFMVVAGSALMASRAVADEHATRISEVFLSDPLQGDAVQFVELFNVLEEPFPEDTYHLGIYDTGGALLDTVPVDVPPGTRRYLVASVAAEAMFDVRPDARLTARLPAEGQVCFEVTEEGDNEVISCLAYGCVDQLVESEFENDTGMAPFEGQSISRQSDDQSYEVADPTPARPNMEGISGQPDCAPPPDEEPPPDDTPPPDMDEQPPPDDDDGGCAVASAGSSSSLALVGLGLLALRRRRRRHHVTH